MKILDVKQGTDEWLDARLGLVTASEMDNLITPGWKVKDMDSAGPRTYLYRKIAEAWLCRPVNLFGSFATDQGNALEPEARPWFELAHDCEVSTRAGFILTDCGRAGCSPDGIIVGKDEGLEIKCPQETNAVRYAIEGILPPDYELQVHASMFVTGFDRWHFVSYHRKLPKLHLVINRDECKCAKIQEALTAFYARFDEGWNKLNEIADEPRNNPFVK